MLCIFLGCAGEGGGVPGIPAASKHGVECLYLCNLLYSFSLLSFCGPKGGETHSSRHIVEENLLESSSERSWMGFSNFLSLSWMYTAEGPSCNTLSLLVMMYLMYLVNAKNSG